MKRELERDNYGRIDGLHYKSGIHVRCGWYYNGEFVAYQLREAYRIIKDRLKTK
jgi:hypothetical protein